MVTIIIIAIVIYIVVKIAPFFLDKMEAKLDRDNEKLIRERQSLEREIQNRKNKMQNLVNRFRGLVHDGFVPEWLPADAKKEIVTIGYTEMQAEEYVNDMMRQLNVTVDYSLEHYRVPANLDREAQMDAYLKTFKIARNMGFTDDDLERMYREGHPGCSEGEVTVSMMALLGILDG